jgi:hypothetical protein
MNSIDQVYALTLDVGTPPPPPPPPTTTEPPPPSSTTLPAPPVTSATTLSSVLITLEAEEMPTKTAGGPIERGWSIWSNGYVEAAVDFPGTGTYRFVIYAAGQPALGIPPDMELRIDQQPVKAISIAATGWTQFTIDAQVTAGTRHVAIAFTNDYYAPSEDRNLFVDKISIGAVSIGAPAVPGPASTAQRLIVGPRSGEILQGRLTPVIASTTQTNVRKLEIYIDGELKATATSGNSVRYLWDPRQLGMHTVEVFAFDSASVVGYWSQIVQVK